MIDKKGYVPASYTEWLLAIISLPTLIMASPVILAIYTLHKLFGDK